jgi:uncharacterized protein YciI
MFVVLLTYTTSLDQVDAHLPAHRRFLSSHYAAGVFLLSGRKEPRDGGVILAQTESRQALEAVLAQDPFRVHGVASYQIVEFTPTMAAPSLDTLIAAFPARA